MQFAQVHAAEELTSDSNYTSGAGHLAPTMATHPLRVLPQALRSSLPVLMTDGSVAGSKARLYTFGFPQALCL